MMSSKPRPPVLASLKRTDPLQDPAMQALLRSQEAMVKRQRIELQEALSLIHERVDSTLKKYEAEINAVTSEANIKDPAYLYELLGDSCHRLKYQQKWTVFILGLEEKCAKRERLLVSLQNFFLHGQSRSTPKFLDQFEENHFDLDDATIGLKSAMDTAQHAVEKLMAIKQEMNRLIAIIAAYPDIKKEEKKVEKALKEIQTLSSSLEQAQLDVRGSRVQVEELQTRKMQDINNFELDASKTKFLQIAIDTLSDELKVAQARIVSLETELEDTRRMFHSRSELQTAHRNKIQELEQLLAHEKLRYKLLLFQKKELEDQHKQELEAPDSQEEEEFNVDMDEDNVGYEEQLKNLEEFLVSLQESETNNGNSNQAGKDQEVQDTPNSLEANNYLSTSVAIYQEVQDISNSLEANDHCKNKQEEEDIEDLHMEQGEEHNKPKHKSSHTNGTNTIQQKVPDSISSVAISADVQAVLLNKTPFDNPTSGSDSCTPTSYTKSRYNSITKDRRESLSGGVHQASVPSSVIQKIRQEYEFKEKKFEKDIDELKIKSRKIVTALRAQLALNQTQSSAELMLLSKEAGNLRIALAALKDERIKLVDQISVAGRDKTELLNKLMAAQDQLELQNLCIKNLQQKVNEKDNAASNNLLTMVDRSTQYSKLEFDSSEETTSMGLSGSATTKEEANLSTQVNACPLEEVTHPQQLQPQITVIPEATGSSVSSLSPPKSAIMSTHDDPVVMEWIKLCDDVRLFRETVVGALCLSGRFRSLADSFLAIDLHIIDRSQDVHSETIATRVSLALLLHQLSQCLTDILKEVAYDELAIYTSKDRNIVNELRATVERLKWKLREQESRKCIQLKESKKKIAPLSHEVSSLKMELVSLRQSMTLATSKEKSVIMFTRMNYERNRQTLISALEKKRISSSVYNKVVTMMNKYLSISQLRFSHLSQYTANVSSAKQLVRDVQHHYKTSLKAVEVLDRLFHLQQRKRLQFSVDMDQLGLKRLNLAYSLTYILKQIEKHAGVFLIKPVFFETDAQSMILPISRPLPMKRLPNQTHTGTPHLSMRQVNSLKQNKQKSKDIITVEKAQQANTFTASELEWSVESSRPISQTNKLTNSLAVGIAPIYPKILEIDIRHHQNLLGHNLPRLHQTQAVCTHKITPQTKQVEQEQVTTVVSKSKVLPSQSSQTLTPMKMRDKFEFLISRNPLPPLATVEHT